MEIKRNRYLNTLISKKHNGLIKVITGMRRCGKSYLLFTLFKEHLLSDGKITKMIENDYGTTYMTGTAADTLSERSSLVALPINENIEASVILAYGKTTSLSMKNKNFMDYIIANYPKYQLN